MSKADTTELYKAIKFIQGEIIKEALLIIDSAVRHYNSNNKYRIDLVGLWEDTIVLEADPEALGTAVDIMDRNLIKAFNRYVNRVQAVRFVNSGGQPK